MSAFAEPVVAWCGSTDPDSPLVVLLHGRGSNEADIIGLADHLPTGAAYAAVRAPSTEGRGYALSSCDREGRLEGARPIPGAKMPAFAASVAGQGVVVVWVSLGRPAKSVALACGGRRAAVRTLAARHRAGDWGQDALRQTVAVMGESPGPGFWAPVSMFIDD